MKDNIFKILADETKLRIIVLLIDREMCMSHIYLGLALKQSNTSRNLKILSDANIVVSRTKKNNRYYKLNEQIQEELSDIFSYLNTIKNESLFQADVTRLKSVTNCSCIGFCECRI